MSSVFDFTSRSQHVMLVYNNISDRNLASINYINQGLKAKQLCVYASVDATNSSHLRKISLQINNYNENINKRNLLIVNLKPFYDSALAGDLAPFEDFKMQLLQELKKDGNKDHKGVLIVADCADYLSRSMHFEKCIRVEKWWQDVYEEWVQGQQAQQHNYSINIICPHPGYILNRHPFDQYKKQIFHNHSITIDTCDCIFADYTSTYNKQNTQQPAVIRKPISIDDFAETPLQHRTSSQIHFLICETCFWCASLVSQVPDHATILNWHTCKDKRIRSYIQL
jgi:hypothetical protein